MTYPLAWGPPWACSPPRRSTTPSTSPPSGGRSPLARCRDAGRRSRRSRRCAARRRPAHHRVAWRCRRRRRRLRAGRRHLAGVILGALVGVVAVVGRVAAVPMAVAPGTSVGVDAAVGRIADYQSDAADTAVDAAAVVLWIADCPSPSPSPPLSGTPPARPPSWRWVPPSASPPPRGRGCCRPAVVALRAAVDVVAVVARGAAVGAVAARERVAGVAAVVALVAAVGVAVAVGRGAGVAAVAALGAVGRCLCHCSRRGSRCWRARCRGAWRRRWSLSPPGWEFTAGWLSRRLAPSSASPPPEGGCLACRLPRGRAPPTAPLASWGAPPACQPLWR